MSGAVPLRACEPQLRECGRPAGVQKTGEANLGPLQILRIVTAVRARRDRPHIASARACSSCVPCEKLRRATLIPASTSRRIISGWRDGRPERRDDLDVPLTADRSHACATPLLSHAAYSEPDCDGTVNAAGVSIRPPRAGIACRAPILAADAQERGRPMTEAAAVGEVNPAGGSRILLLCDHATNVVPPDVAGGDLGLPPEEMAAPHRLGHRRRRRHRGARPRCSTPPALLTRFSRLVIDPNRGEDDPTLVMRLYDGTVIPANRAVAPRRGRAAARRLPPALPPRDRGGDRAAARRRPRARARLDPFVHPAAQGPARRGRGRSASSGIATAASPCR